jgi:hypothetical protein
VNNAQ